MPQSTTPQHCPGFEQLRKLSVFECRCPECGQAKEIFSDEFDRSHHCTGCGRPIDFTRCSIDGRASTTGPR